MSTSIFVCGATGTQGGAVINNLQTSKVKIHAIARDLSTPSAQALQSTGISVFKGDFNDESSLQKAMQGCTALFLNLAPDLTNMSTEVSQAKRILSVAKTVGIQQIIYSSGFGAQEPQRLKPWDPNSVVAKILGNKRTIELEVERSGFKYWTVLRPGNFMTNFLPPLVHMMYPGLVEQGQFTTALLPETVLPMVDPNDIGKFTVAALLDPSRFHEQEIELASDLLRLDDLVNSLSQAVGRDLKAVYMTQEEIDQQLSVNPMLVGQLCMRNMVQFLDMEKLQSWGISLGSFEQFLEREKVRVVKGYCSS